MDEIKMTSDQMERIRLLEDGDLFHRAVTFAHSQPSVENKQLAGLLEFSRSWKELTYFVHHQKGRTWTGRKAPYQDFYNALDSYLQQDLRSQVKGNLGLIPAELTKKETNRRIDHFAGLLAQSFIQHLVAEMRWQEEVKL